MILDQLPPTYIPRFTLLAPVHGDARPLHTSSQALDKLAILGQGMQLYPRTSVVLAPADCSIVQISADHRRWELRCPNGLRIRLLIHGISHLPVAFADVTQGESITGNTPLFHLPPACLQQGVRLTLHVLIKDSHAVFLHSGNRRGGEDPLLSVFQQKALAAAEQR